MKYLVFILLLYSCTGNDPKKGPSPAAVPATSSQMSYLGLYECADCPDGIVSLQLSENFSYSITGPAEYSGTYRWSDDGKTVELKRAGLPDLVLTTAPKALVFGSTGDTLHKIPSGTAAKTDAPAQPKGIPAARWTLIELHGKAARKIQAKDSFIEVAQNGTFTAYAGCNSIGGKYTINQDSISFTDVIQTQMACEGDHREAQFTDALHNADNFIRNGKSLQIRKGQKVLAKFEAMAKPNMVR